MSISYFSNRVLYFKDEVDDLELFDLNGNSVLAQSHTNSNLALPNLNTGVYLVTYKKLGKYYIEKIMLE